jgi:hypothetical protein
VDNSQGLNDAVVIEFPLKICRSFLGLDYILIEIRKRGRRLLPPEDDAPLELARN